MTSLALAFSLLLAADTPPSRSALGSDACRLALHQLRVDVRERELDVELAGSRFEAAQSALDLAAQRFADGAIERLEQVRAQHARDVAELERARSRLLLIRQQAALEHREALCADADAAPARRRARLDAAYARYAQADCHRIGKELAIAEADVAYLRERLADLEEKHRQGALTREEVLPAERELRDAQRRQRHYRPRVEACIASGAARGRPPEAPNAAPEKRQDEKPPPDR